MVLNDRPAATVTKANGTVSDLVCHRIDCDIDHVAPNHTPFLKGEALDGLMDYHGYTVVPFVALNGCEQLVYSLAWAFKNLADPPPIDSKHACDAMTFIESRSLRSDRVHVIGGHVVS